MRSEICYFSLAAPFIVSTLNFFYDVDASTNSKTISANIYLLMISCFASYFQHHWEWTRKQQKNRRNKWNVLKIICWKFEQVEKFCKFFVLFCFCLHLKVYIILKTMNCINIHTAKAIARARARAQAGAIHHAICNINFVYRCWIKYRAYRYGKLVQFKDRITDLMTAHSNVVHKFHIIIHENHKNEVFVVYWRINGIDRIEQHLLLYRTI